MSQKTNQDGKSLSPEEQRAKEAVDQAANAAAGQDPIKTPEEAANDVLSSTGETPAQKIAKAIDAVYQLNPDAQMEDIVKLVTSVFIKQENPKSQVEKEAARIITQAASRDYKKRIYLKKDKDRKFPLDESALNGIIVRQTYKKKTEEGDDITVPARNLNEIGIYTQEDFDALNEEGRGFEREGITVEIWHKPGQEGTVQEEE